MSEETATNYTCQHCGGRFVSFRNPTAVEEEMRENFGELPGEERATICDVCYKDLMAWAKREGIL